jgi:hypothetical protein
VLAIVSQAQTAEQLEGDTGEAAEAVTATEGESEGDEAASEEAAS